MTVLEAADWFLSRNAKEVVSGQGSLLRCAKLMRLLYLAQAAHISETGTPLFAEDIERWRYGPVSREVFAAFRDEKDGITSWSAVTSEIPARTGIILEDIFSRFASVSDWKLSAMLEAEFREEGIAVNSFVDLEKSAEYYREHFAPADQIAAVSFED